jgi:uncharacterized protein YxjI
MRQQMMSIGDDYWIENDARQRMFHVDGKALRLRKTLVLQTPDGRELFKIQKQLVSIRDTMEIENATGTVASIKKALISPFRDRFQIEFENGAEWTAEGRIGDHEYHVDGPGGRIAEVSKKWFRVRDSYGIHVAPGQNDAFVLMVTIAIDQLSH